MNAPALPPKLQRAFLNGLMRRSLGHFHASAFGMLHAGEPILPGRHIEAMVHALERLARGEIKRLIINLPPRHGKSELASASFPAWLLGHDPSAKVTVVSYGLELSKPLIDKARLIIKNPRYGRIFPRTLIARGWDRAEEFRTTCRGGVRAASKQGAMTGLGTHYMIVDDFHKAGEVLSPVERENAIETFRATFLTRFDNLADARIVIVQQRLHEDDLVGWAKTHGDWHHLNLPAVAEFDEEIALSGGRTWQRTKGDVLAPALASREYLQQQEALLGERDYGAQFQQDPGRAGGGFIDWGWFGQYHERLPRNFFHKIVQSIDPAFSELQTGDFSVGMTWGYHDPYWYLLDLFREHEGFGPLLDRIKLWHRQWRADALLIERTSSGDALFDQVKAARLPGLIRSPQPRLSKGERLIAASVHLRSGNFLLPASAEWLPALKRELVGFPNMKHDDQVDALSQFVGFVFNSKGWINTEYDANGRRVSVSRRARRPRYYDGDIPSAESWKVQ